MTRVTVAAALRDEDIETVRRLLNRYWDALGFDGEFQGFASEVAGLPGGYAQPEGRLGLARIDGEAVGCVALRRLTAERCEAKRLYVKPECRGRGVGRILLEWLIGEARAAGYGELYGDTLPPMAQALGLYESVGFEQTAAYKADATPGAIYLRLGL